MIINPPNDDNYDYFEIDKDTGRPADENTERFERIKIHCTKPTWHCPVCECNNSHDNQRCVYCFAKNGVITPKVGL